MCKTTIVRRLYYCLLNPKLLYPHFKKGLLKLFSKNMDYEWDLKHNLYEIATIEYIKSVIKKGDTFIDVGANVGYFEKRLLQTLGKTGHIYAFEPQIKLARHSGGNVTWEQVACGSKNGKGQLHILKEDYGGGSSLVGQFIEKQETHREITERVEVPIIRLDEYIERRNIKNIKLIKIDTEMYDFEVLKGLSGYFDKGFRPIIVCEVQDKEVYKNILGQDIQEFIDYMAKYGYSAHNIYLPWQKLDLTKPIKVGNIIFKAK